MSKDDRIFALVGAGVVTAVAAVAVLVLLGAGITVDAPQHATVVVPLREAPASAASSTAAASDGRAADRDDDENEAVRKAIARLSEHPRFAAFLINDRLLVRFVTAVDAVAGGYSPRDQVEFLRPQRPFLVREADSGLVAAAGSYHRYDLAAEVVDSISVPGAVDLYHRFRPRLEEIYGEISWGGDDFDSRLCEAIDHLLEVEWASGPFELEQRAIVYAYADESIEGLTDAQKQLLRMGPGNAALVLAKLRDLRRALGWPDRPTTDSEAEIEMTAPDPIVASATTEFVPASVTEKLAQPVGAVAAP